MSIGRYVLAGGELAAMVVCDAVLRKLPGALGHEESALEESFSAALEGAPEYPHYTRPAEYRGWSVPEVLLSGHHARSASGGWPRARPAQRATARRPRLRRRSATIGRPRAGACVCSAPRPTPAIAGAADYVAMSTVIDSLERAQLRRVPAFDAGDRVRVHFQVIEGTRRRTQVFEGIVIKRQGHGARETFTVRKQSFGVGVERTFPLHSPKIERIEVAARGDVRRAKLYYLRGRVGKRARVRERRNTGPEEAVQRELLYGPEDDGDEASPTSASRRSPAPTADAPVAEPRSRPTPPARRPRKQAAAAEESGAEESEESASSTAPQDAGPAADEEPAGEDKGDRDEEVAGELADRARGDRGGRARPGARDPGVRRQAVPDSQRLDAADAAHQPARAGQPDRHRISPRPHVGDIIVFHPPKNYDDGCADPSQGANRAGQPAAQACDVAADASLLARRSSSGWSGCRGDRISIVNGHVIRNGMREQRPLHRALRR